MFDSYQQRVPKLIVPYNDAKGEIHWFTIIFPIKIEKLIDLRDIGNTVYIYRYIYIYRQYTLFSDTPAWFPSRVC